MGQLSVKTAEMNWGGQGKQRLCQALCVRRLAPGQTCLLSSLCPPTKLGVWVGLPHLEEGVPSFHSNTGAVSLQAIYPLEAAFIHPGALNRSLCGRQQPCLLPPRSQRGGPGVLGTCVASGALCLLP